MRVGCPAGGEKTNARGLIADTVRATSELEWADNANPGLLFDPLVPDASDFVKFTPRAFWRSLRLPKGLWSRQTATVTALKLGLVSTMSPARAQSVSFCA